MAEAVKAAKEIAQSASRGGPPFRMGTKQVFLPSHVITMMRHNTANEAQFHVPLTFTKLDMRDYLWNLYGVEAVNVRSRVQGTPIRRKDELSNKFYRPMFNKYMIITLKQPFRFPTKPRDEEAFAHSVWKMRQDMRDQQDEAMEARREGKVPALSEKSHSKQRIALRNYAQKLLDGEEKWDNGLALDPKWDDIVQQSRGITESRNEMQKETPRQRE